MFDVSTAWNQNNVMRRTWIRSWLFSRPPPGFTSTWPSAPSTLQIKSWVYSWHNYKLLLTNYRHYALSLHFVHVYILLHQKSSDVSVIYQLFFIFIKSLQMIPWGEEVMASFWWNYLCIEPCNHAIVFWVLTNTVHVTPWCIMYLTSHSNRG